MRIFLLDTVYPEVLKHMPITGDYETSLRSALDFAFGTSDFFSRNLRALGHECVDVIANHHQLQYLWAKSEKWSLPAIALQQIESFKPDVLFLQDLSFFDASTLRMLGDRYVLAGQCSCALPRAENMARFDVIFTSIPPHVERFKSLGVRGEYLPLAFESRMLTPSMMEVIAIQTSTELGFPDRDIDLCFVGGVGANSHWKAGTRMLEAVAERFNLEWWGYGLDNLGTNSLLRTASRGSSWGRDMYDKYRRARIVLNRHGEVSQGFANNLRLYEASGMGAMVLTEAAPNLAELFPRGTMETYSSTPELLEKIDHYLTHDSERQRIAQAGQEWTLSNHTYQHRMQRVSEVLTECLKPQPSIA